MKKILNLTQHMITREQENKGVFEPELEDKNKIKELLTFNDIPSKQEINKRAKELTKIAKKYDDVKKVMIGGALFLMSFLERELKNNNIVPLYAFIKE